jgi:hypothetical protein
MEMGWLKKMTNAAELPVSQPKLETDTPRMQSSGIIACSDLLCIFLKKYGMSVKCTIHIMIENIY